MKSLFFVLICLSGQDVFAGLCDFFRKKESVIHLPVKVSKNSLNESALVISNLRDIVRVEMRESFDEFINAGGVITFKPIKADESTFKYLNPNKPVMYLSREAYVFLRMDPETAMIKNNNADFNFALNDAVIKYYNIENEVKKYMRATGKSRDSYFALYHADQF